VTFISTRPKAGALGTCYLTEPRRLRSQRLRRTFKHLFSSAPQFLRHGPSQNPGTYRSGRVTRAGGTTQKPICRIDVRASLSATSKGSSLIPHLPHRGGVLVQCDVTSRKQGQLEPKYRDKIPGGAVARLAASANRRWYERFTASIGGRSACA